MWHTIGKLSTRATTLLQTSLQLEVYMWSYAPPKLQGLQLREFRDSHLGVSGQKTIWMWPPWRGVKYIIRGKVVASPKFGLWWVLWVRGCMWFVLAPKVFQLCTNHFVLVLCGFTWVIEACQFFLIPSRSSNMALYPSKVLQTKDRASTPYSPVVFSLDSHLNPSRSWEHVSKCKKVKSSHYKVGLQKTMLAYLRT
jgi:hypothetical protein